MNLPWKHRLKQATIVACSCLCVLIVIGSLFVESQTLSGIIIKVVIDLLLLVWAFTIYKQYRWALRLAGLVFLLTAMVLPLAAFCALQAGDLLLVGMKPTIANTLLWLIPMEGLLLGIVFIIDPKDKKPEDQSIEK